MKKIFILVCSCALLAACNNSAKTNKSAGADSTSIEVTDIHNAENSAQLQISVAYFCSIGLYFLV